jgi:tetratricopeptide (TPR) repeat protein
MGLEEQVSGKNFSELAEDAFKRRDFSTALRNYSFLYLEIGNFEDPTDPEVMEVLSNIKIKIGLCYQEKGNLEKTIMEFEKASELKPNNFRIPLEIGKLYYELDKEKIGRNYFLKSFRILPENLKELEEVDSANELALCLVDVGEYDSAEILYDRLHHVGKIGIHGASFLLKEAMFDESIDFQTLFDYAKTFLFCDEYEGDPRGLVDEKELLRREAKIIVSKGSSPIVLTGKKVYDIMEFSIPKHLRVYH